MSKSTLPRLNALREEMGKAGITAFIIPGTDPHQSEYYATHWAARTWITGFNGSAGTAVVTTNQAGLWTDSRYFLQAAQQLEASTSSKRDYPIPPPSSNGCLPPFRKELLSPSTARCSVLQKPLQ